MLLREVERRQSLLLTLDQNQILWALVWAPPERPLLVRPGATINFVAFWAEVLNVMRRVKGRESATRPRTLKPRAWVNERRDLLFKASLDQLDGRSVIAREANALRLEIVAALGGNVSPQQNIVIEVVVRTKIYLDTIDGWLAKQPSIVDRRRRALIPVVVQRQAVADSLVKNLEKLGLERKLAPVEDLSTYLAKRKGRA